MLLVEVVRNLLTIRLKSAVESSSRHVDFPQIGLKIHAFSDFDERVRVNHLPPFLIEVGVDPVPDLMHPAYRTGRRWRSAHVVFALIERANHLLQHGCHGTGLQSRPSVGRRCAQRVSRLDDLPDYMWSMDSRAVAVSETVEATGSLQAAQELATHSTPKMTKRYSRCGGLQSSRRIAEMRAEMRK